VAVETEAEEVMVLMEQLLPAVVQVVAVGKVLVQPQVVVVQVVVVLLSFAIQSILLLAQQKLLVAPLVFMAEKQSIHLQTQAHLQTPLDRLYPLNTL
jgi:hypothetical protein